ncbi:unnamed protein product [Macrosiphum euphorbiae]|uniref:Transposase domain-containing protein n=1 Tax=Macrosiphum euphorbiae TaxID=13131 RepID=A0AAV0XTD4_9HEMI|nr:unnamed protein product [Macrosiphum euphorbiae]
MPFCQKNFNLSVRSKRRRVTEELKNNVPINLVDPVLSTSSTSENVTTTSHLNSNLDNIFFLPSNQPTQNSSNQLNASHIRHDLNDSQIIPNNLNIHRSEKHNNSNLIDENIDFEPSDPSQTPSDDIKCLIRKWSIEFNIPQIALNKLLRILKRHKCFDSFPLDSRTLMQNNNKHLGISKLKTIEPGSYYHFGIENGIKLNMVDNVRNVSVIEIAVGIDGLPLYKSSSDQFWPILAYIRPNGHVFPIGIYHGKDKPSDSNKFILDFIEEAKLLMQNGVRINGKMYDFHVSVLCCDAPAKSYVLRTKGHSGFSSCSRCEHEGEYIQNRVCFPYLKPERCPPKRTHQNYITRLNEDHHIKNNSIIATLPNFDVVYGFSMDYLHLVCLGTVRKLINLWIKGPIKVRYPSWKINEMSISMNRLKINIPCEIARKTRGFDQVNRWKATEFRTFLLYVGAIVTKPVISDAHWKHFLNLSISMIILLSPDFSEYLNYARKLLESFVENFQILYGSYLISHNIHGLTHICDDYINFGPLDQCSTFPFENYMGTLKRMLRKPDKPLEQIINRYNEMASIPCNTEKKDFYFSGLHNKGPLLDSAAIYSQFTTYKCNRFTLKTHIEADSYVLTKDNNIVKVFNIIQAGNENEAIIICKQFINPFPLFKKPIESTYLNIYVVNKLNDKLISFNIKDIKKKVCVFPSGENLIVFPLLHSCTK